MSNQVCHYCGTLPTIDNSHVVPRFVGMHIKANSPFGYLINAWRRNPQYDIHKGPYLCATCDNEIFSAWENKYANTIWKKPFDSADVWGDEIIIHFVISLAYRYALHFLETSPIQANWPYNQKMRDLMKESMLDISKVGKSLYIYPYLYREISNHCELLPGVNHLLQLAVHGESLPSEEGLPNAMLVIIPGAIFLFCEGDLAKYPGNELSNPQYLKINSPFNASEGNVEMPSFLKVILNRQIGQGQAHQKQIGRWKRLAYGADKRLNPDKVCYLAQEQDKKLQVWQRNHCSA